ncbi:2-oxoacid dehydrogenase acyltransferase [Cyathus striatus]|nr:2-oxoacid dehydrogenase acyltransferase [Cyathus striatus]
MLARTGRLIALKSRPRTKSHVHTWETDIQDVDKLFSSKSSREKDIVVELENKKYEMWKDNIKNLEVPHFGYSTTLDLTALHLLLPKFNSNIPKRYLPPSERPSSSASQINPLALCPVEEAEVPESGQYTKLTYLPMLLKTLSKAMEEWPLFRSSITAPSSSPSGANLEAKPALTIRPNADIAIDLSTPTGVYTPTLQNVNLESMYSISSRIKHLTYLSRQVPPQQTPNDISQRGGTITVSNIGALGKCDFAQPVLVPGGSLASVALGRAMWKWDVEDDYWMEPDDDDYYERRSRKGERRLKMGVCWSADRRVVEGTELAAFMECWRDWVEKPEWLIAGGV